MPKLISCSYVTSYSQCCQNLSTKIVEKKEKKKTKYRNRTRKCRNWQNKRLRELNIQTDSNPTKMKGKVSASKGCQLLIGLTLADQCLLVVGRLLVSMLVLFALPLKMYQQWLCVVIKSTKKEFTN